MKTKLDFTQMTAKVIEEFKAGDSRGYFDIDSMPWNSDRTEGELFRKAFKNQIEFLNR